MKNNLLVLSLLCVALCTPWAAVYCIQPDLLVKQETAFGNLKYQNVIPFFHPLRSGGTMRGEKIAATEVEGERVVALKVYQFDKAPEILVVHGKKNNNGSISPVETEATFDDLAYTINKNMHSGYLPSYDITYNAKGMRQGPSTGLEHLLNATQVLPAGTKIKTARNSNEFTVISDEIRPSEITVGETRKRNTSLKANMPCETMRCKLPFFSTHSFEVYNFKQRRTQATEFTEVRETPLERVTIEKETKLNRWGWGTIALTATALGAWLYSTKK